MNTPTNTPKSTTHTPGTPSMKTRHARRAFTLVEVMIVLAIVLVLAGLVGVKLFAQRDKANIKMAQQQISSIQSALKLFRLDFERYPNDEEGIAVLWEKELLSEESDIANYTTGGYLESSLETDYWGNEWGYEIGEDENTGEPTYRVWSFGPDKEDGTEDDVKFGKTSTDEEEGLGSDFGMGG